NERCRRRNSSAGPFPGALRCGFRLRCGRGAYQFPSSFAVGTRGPPPDHGQHVAERLEGSMNDILCFAELAKRSFCENVIDAAGDASIGMAIADENRGQSSARIHAAGYRALAHPALHFARSVGVWKRQGQTVAAEEEMIGEDRYRRTDPSHGVADGVIESVADDGQLRERAHLAHELREEA